MVDPTPDRATRIALQANDAADAGDWAQAETLYREALAIFEAAGNRHQAAVCRVNLAQIVHRPDNPAEGCALLRESLAEFNELDHREEAAQVEALIDELCDHAVRTLSPEVLAAIHNNTVALLTIASDERESFGDSIRQAADRAQQQGDPDAWAYLTAVARLLEEDIPALDDIAPSIPDTYRPAWNLLVDHLTGQPAPPIRGLSNEVLNVIINDAAAALTHQPEVRDTIRADILAAARSAHAMQRRDESAFLNAVARLLAEGSAALDAIQPDVPPLYRDAWDLLADYLRNPR